jgi:DNA-binding transcriptional regulator YhcF (GntR family)
MPGDDGALFQRVLDSVLDNIRSGLWPPGGPVPSVPQLAALHGVSESTASRVTFLLRFLGFLCGPSGAPTRVGSRTALRHAWAALEAAERARTANSPT